MTPFQDHVQRWSTCRLCSLHETRRRVVHYRGRIPCDVLFVGEAPGRTEDTIGQPFVGPAGQLLDEIIARTFKTPPLPPLSRGFANLVGCIPLEEGGAKKTEEPDDRCIRACSPRLVEISEMARPRLIVAVGSLSRDYLDISYLHSVKIDRAIPRVSIVHPAAILRAPWAARDLMVKRCVVVIRDGITKYLLNGKAPQYASS